MKNLTFLALLITWLISSSNLMAQPDLPCGTFSIEYSADPNNSRLSKRHYYTIPAGIDRIGFTLRGGAGGYARIDCITDLYQAGGGGAVIDQLSYPVGPNVNGVPEDRLEEGGVLLFIVGEHGGNETQFCGGNAQGGGGGSSGVAYLPPGGGSDEYYALAVAGAGGGAILATAHKLGQGGRATQQGGVTRSCIGCGAGGKDGNAGDRGTGAGNVSDGGAGAGILTGSITFEQDHGSKSFYSDYLLGPHQNSTHSYLWVRGRIRSQAGGGATCTEIGCLDWEKGGSGFTGAGISLGSPGGGGGYSGGAPGPTSDDAGGGGGSWYSRYFGASQATIAAGADGGDTGHGIITVRPSYTGVNRLCQDATVTLDPSGHAAINPDDVFHLANTTCFELLSVTPSTVDCSHLGETQVVALWLDHTTGTQHQCASTVTVKSAPVTPSCQDLEVRLGTNGTSQITPEMHLTGTLLDACGRDLSDISMTYSEVNCNDIGTLTNVIRGKDPEGRAWECSATITVLDDSPPFPAHGTCRQTHEVMLNDVDLGSLAVAPGMMLTAAPYDNCSGHDPSLPYSITVNGEDINRLDCSHIGENTLVMSVTDHNGNTNPNYCTTTLTVLANPNSEFLCKDATVLLRTNGTYTLQESDVFSGCGNITYTGVSPSTLTCADIGSITVTVSGVDDHGNTHTCEAQVTVTWDYGPIAMCATGIPIIEISDGGSVDLTAALLDGGSLPACSYDDPDELTFSFSPASVSCADLGTVDYTMVVTAPDGKKDLCTGQLQVQAPLSCNFTTVTLSEDGVATLDPLTMAAGPLVDCGHLDQYTLSVSPSQFDCDQVDENILCTLTATPIRGGEPLTCQNFVQVLDEIRGTALCKDVTIQLDENGMASLTPADVDDGSSDNCDFTLQLGLPNELETYDQLQFDCAQLGTNAILLNVLRDGSLQSQCLAQVTVEDRIAPSITCQDLTLELGADGSVTVNAADLIAQSQDNCAGALTLSPSEFTYDAEGTYSLWINASDASGNQTFCTPNITVLPYPGGQGLKLQAKVMLEGPYVSGDQRMHDQLRSGSLLPLSEPYSGLSAFSHVGGGGGESVASSVLSQSGADGIVDWVLVELRDASDPTDVLYTRSGLLQRDGDIVDIDGSSPVNFDGAAAGNYYVCVRHRNHLGIMTSGTIGLSTSPAVVDFTSSSTSTFGTNARANLGGGMMGMYAADIDASGAINASDRSTVWNDRNLTGYRDSDINMDGTTNASDRSVTWNNRNLEEQVPE